MRQADHYGPAAFGSQQWLTERPDYLECATVFDDEAWEREGLLWVRDGIAERLGVDLGDVDRIIVRAEEMVAAWERENQRFGTWRDREHEAPYARQTTIALWCARVLSRRQATLHRPRRT
jgi:hypothetical protein